MKRSFAPILLLALSVCAFGQLVDPNVGVFDPGAACAPTCGTHPNPIPLTEFGVWNFGKAGEEANPWYIIFAVPDNNGGQPTLSSDASSPDQFTANFAGDAGAYFPNPPQKDTLYEFAGPKTALTSTEIHAANNSMANTNMFGAAEMAALGGSLPSFFEVYVYGMSGVGGSSGSLPHQVAEFFDTSIVAGTFVAVLGASVDAKGHEKVFASPFTTAGLGGGPASTSTSATGVASASAGGVPEPSGIVLLGSALLAVTAGVRKKLMRS